MRLLISKYDGQCAKCSTTLSIGDEIAYEKFTGVFCPSCFPTDSEEIRAYRQARNDRKAAKYQEWADKRIKKASAVFDHNRRYTSDYAFNTQPGHIPLRARIIAQNDRAYESLEKARGMERKAESLSAPVAVKGDAEKRDIAKRAFVDTWIKPEMMVDTCHYGVLKVLKVNKKTVTLEGRFGKLTHDKIFIRQVKAQPCTTTNQDEIGAQ